MAKELLAIGKTIRQRKATQVMRQLGPEVEAVLSDLKRQLAEKDAEIARLNDQIDALAKRRKPASKPRKARAAKK